MEHVTWLWTEWWLLVVSITTLLGGSLVTDDNDDDADDDILILFNKTIIVQFFSDLQFLGKMLQIFLWCITYGCEIVLLKFELYLRKCSLNLNFVQCLCSILS